jgi:tellurite resistance protein
MSTASETAEAPAGAWLAHLPVALFTIVMGLGGLGLAWRRAAEALGAPAAVGEAILLAAGLVFVGIAGLYLAKVVRHPGAAVAEFEHPVKVAFFPAMSVGLLLLAAGALYYSRAAAELLWIIAAVLHLSFAVIIFRRWIVRNVELQHSSPAWFIPVVGNIVAPLAGAPLGYGEVSWFFLSVGLVFWLVLFAIVLNRIIFHDQMPEKFLPTLFILLAPPAIGMVAYVTLTGAVDGFARVLFFAALFIALLLASMAPLFLRLKFALGWWAYTFPSASLAGAALIYHQAIDGPVTLALAVGLLAAASGIIGLVALQTCIAVANRRLIGPD